MRAIFAEHIAPINRFIDRLRREVGWLPYVAPIYGGTRARLLSLLRDPGPGTLADAGSGLLSMENDDRTAAHVCALYRAAGLRAAEVLPWNAYPWYINRRPTAAELESGVPPLHDLLALLPDLRVVLLHGRSAENVWRRFTRRHPTYLSCRPLRVLATYHPSPQAFWHRDVGERARRRAALEQAVGQAAALLHTPMRATPNPWLHLPEL